MADQSTSSRHYWERHVDADGKWDGEGPSGGDLAALRRGAGRVAGDVPEMWRFYTTLQTNGDVSTRLLAEHAALTLYAIHQQSKKRSMHRSGIGLGTAMRALRKSEKFSEEAVDRRFSAAATATSFTEICLHLRGLITQLRTIDQPLDYTQLYVDLRNWQVPDRLSGVRRRWGSQYFTTKDTPAGDRRTEASGGAGTGGDPTLPVPRQDRGSDPVITLQEIA